MSSKLPILSNKKTGCRQNVHGLIRVQIGIGAFHDATSQQKVADDFWWRTDAYQGLEWLGRREVESDGVVE